MKRRRVNIMKNSKRKGKDKMNQNEMMGSEEEQKRSQR